MNLTIEQMRKIVDGAPESNFPVKWCLVRKKYVRQVGFNTQHLVNGEWIDEFNVNPWIDLDSLRTALADHDRTDHVTDIQNHISPNTRVSEAHVNEAFKLNGLG